MEKVFSILAAIFLLMGGIVTITIGDERDEMEVFSGTTDIRVNRISRSPIRINNNSDFMSQATAEGWSGNGTQLNPYIIENYDIDAEGAGNAIYIGNTTAYFIIRGCEVYNTSYQYSAPYSRGSGITLYNVQNGIVENNILRDNPDDEGIYLESSSQNSIVNNTIFNDYYGITLYYSSNNKIYDNNISSTGYHGIYLWGASNNTLLNNSISGGGGNGIRLYSYSSYNMIKNSTISGSDYGIYMQSYCMNNTIELNDILDSSQMGIYLYDYSDNNRISDNFINNSFFDSIHIFVCSNTTVEYNTVMNSVNGAGIHLYWYSYDTIIFSNYIEGNMDEGIWIESNSDRTEIMWNTLSDNYMEGISITDSSYINITGNFLSGSTAYSGVKFYNSAHNIVDGNEMYSNYDCGIWLLSSSDTDISYNTIYGNRYGIYLQTSANTRIFNNSVYSNTIEGITLVSGSFDNDIHNNSITENSEYGIRFDSSDSNSLHNNTIQGNAQYGIYLNNANFSRIYANDFINNGIQAYDNGTNYWNLTYPRGGNYWSDYSGTDIYSGAGQDIPGSDGFGDNPYNISGGSNTDNYPIMGMSIALDIGWNLISVPWQRDLVGIESSLGGTSWDRAMIYMDGEWHTYSKNRNAVYNLGFPPVDNTMGIWVHVTSNSTLCGPSRDIGSTTMWLPKGWNLVGYPSNNNTRTVAEALQGISYAYVQAYDNRTGQIITLADTDNMEPWKGYWIYVTADCLWTVEW